MRRREVMTFTAGALLGFLSGPVFLRAQPADEVLEPDFSEAPPVTFAEGERVPTLEEYRANLEALTGAQNPFEAEIRLGKKLLEDISSDQTPYQIAFRFHQWRQGLVGATDKEKRQYSYYTREWPIRGNPIIMGYFDATGLRTPEGDTTYWCAAFVSWCIQKSRENKRDNGRVWPYERGAGSAAYRTWGKDVIRELNSSPMTGDLAVFQHQRTPWRGHVGFVHEVNGTAIRVLGGNQGAQNDFNGGEVNISKFSTQPAGSLKFHSFRRHEALG
ncbi:CHAP domain-containing protein [Sinorhizobium meliloti]|nr:CHAP domain-containing protein [Sinorhizobium meliloti]MDX0238252.1 CHAP domain-containing protein [Sinorhizobium meliloti]